MDNKKYFYVSGFISLSLFGFFLSMFVVMLFKVHDIKTYGLKKENYISVSINLTPQKKSSRKVTSSQSKVKSSIQSKSKNIDVNSISLVCDKYFKLISTIIKFRNEIILMKIN